MEIIDIKFLKDLDEFTFLVHQCNCITNQSKGIAEVIFKQYPYANTYKGRPEKPNFRNLPQKPGSISIHGNGKDLRFIVNFYAQIFPGKNNNPYSENDNPKVREEYFENCLYELHRSAKFDDTIVMPYRIGCNLAGGDWNKYSNIIENFENYTNRKIYLFSFIQNE